MPSLDSTCSPFIFIFDVDGKRRWFSEMFSRRQSKRRPHHVLHPIQPLHFSESLQRFRLNAMASSAKMATPPDLEAHNPSPMMAFMNY